MPKHSRRGKHRFSNHFVERLEARQLLSGVGAATAAGYIWPNTKIASIRGNTSSTKTSSTPTATGSTTVTSLVAPPQLFPAAIYYPAGSGNYSSGRNGTQWIVIHTTESTAASTINEFQTAGLQVSANYMVERSGVIDQFVQNSDTAFHCGNSAYNHDSIGIEHERYNVGSTKFDPTEQEYEASATLVRWLSSYYNIPLVHLAASVAPADPTTGSDVIGHYQVPDPNNPSLGGGANHHTDPVDWDWTHYMDLCTTTTTPLMPVIVGPGAVGSTASVNGVGQTLSWMAAPNETKYQITVKDTTANITTTYTITNGATSLGLTFTTGHAYTWSMTSFNGTTQSIASPTYSFSIATGATLTDAQKQSLMLTMVNNHRGSVQSDVVLAEITQEGGQGAFYVNGSTKNSFYSASIQPWCQPTNNSDGIMQVTSASGFDKHKPYANTQQGYDDAINDGTAYLSANYTTYGTLWQTSLHYNTGPNSLYIYENSMGDKNYLAHIASDLSVVQSLYGIKDPALVSKFNAAQTIVNSFLNNSSILSGQSVSYYASFQTQLDAQLHALGAADDAPNTPTNNTPANGATSVSLTPTLTASAYSDPNTGDTQSASEWLVKRISDGTVVYDSGTDTTDTTSTVVPSGKLANNTQYSWQVRYADTEGTWSAYSTATSFTTLQPPNQPPVMTSLTTSPTTGTVTQGLKAFISPHGVSDPDGTVASVSYYLESNGVSGLQTGAGGDTFVMTSTDAGGGYLGTISTGGVALGAHTYYAFATDNQNANSTPISTTITVVAAATNLTATPTSGVTMHVSWANNSPDGQGFILERSDNGGPYVEITDPGSTDTSFDDTGLTPATTYTYRLQAVSNTGSSTWVVSNTGKTWKSGDANGDGYVNFSDFLIIQNNFNKPGGWLQGDFDGNGIVNFNDFLIFQNAF